MIAGIYLLFTQRLATVKAIIPAAALYLPWLIFTVGYYGSPFPNTMVAKYVGYQSYWWIHWDLSLPAALHQVLMVTRQVFRPLGPCFGGHGMGGFVGLPGYRISYAMMFFAFIAICFILLQRRKQLLPCAMFVLLYSGYYVFLAPGVASWYLVPLAAVTVLLSTYGIGRTIGFLKDPDFRRYSGVFISATYLIFTVTVIPSNFNTDRQIQVYIEDGVRKEIGLYLSTVMEKDQSVGCECLGYIGYYSRRTVYDYPGLCNPRVVEYLKTMEPSQRCLYSMLEYFKPDYIVLRDHEYESFKERGGVDPWVLRDYQVLRWFEADPAKTKDIFGIEYNADTSFVVLQRTNYD